MSKHQQQQQPQQQQQQITSESIPPPPTIPPSLSLNSTPDKDESSPMQMHPQLKSISSPNIGQSTTTTTATTTKSSTSSSKKQNNTFSSNSSGNVLNKRRSSWRNLLTPSYKSRSDEFHKLFCDKIPKTERLIADYACALHREILIQGRVYISVNYIAFYSNLFSWITKLVVRLRDVSEIFKANTARIIPNAIQIITTSGDKHVFASFVARDKSYIMILRIWQNNLMNERMTDQEIRNLVYFSYGKDLGMSDNEELKINSPDPVTPANVPPLDLTSPSKEATTTAAAVVLPIGDRRLVNNAIDRNNNIPAPPPSSQVSAAVAAEIKIDNRNLTNHQEELLSDKLRKSIPSSVQHSIKEQDVYHNHHHQLGSNHSRYNSLDFNTRAGKISENIIIEEVVNKLNEISDSYKLRQEDGEKHCESEKGETFSPTTSSTVIVETPKLLEGTPKSKKSITNDGSLDYGCNPFIEDDNFSKKVNESLPNRSSSYGTTTTSTETEIPLTSVINDYQDSRNNNVVDEIIINSGSNNKDEMNMAATRRVDGEELIELTTHCGCDEHKGQLIVDQEFDINIDTLFTLIFTNSKFIRTYHIRRGMTDTKISSWKRSNTSSNNGGGGGVGGNGDKSNSSTLSTDSIRNCKENSINNKNNITNNDNISELVRIKQVRQLNYSMSLDHMWAKQVQVEERQNICQVKPGIYVLQSKTINSGIPYGETFTVDTSYCLTRNGDINKSRMLVYSCVNFNKDKQNWKLAMVKSMIERQSLQGVKDFIVDLTSCIKEYINETIIERSQIMNERMGGGIKEIEEVEVGSSRKKSHSQLAPISLPRNHHHHHHNHHHHHHQQQQQQQGSRKGSLSRPSSQTRMNQVQYSAKSSGSLIRAKSMLKERKLKSMYRYYIQNDEDIERGASKQVDTNNKTKLIDDDGNNYCIYCDSDDICDSNSEDGSSLVSMSEFDDNGSMMMMVHATDASQYSDDLEDEEEDEEEAEDGEQEGNDNDCYREDFDFDSMDRSFSDVDNSRRRRKRRSFVNKRRKSDMMEAGKNGWQTQTMLQQHQLSGSGTKRSTTTTTTTTATRVRRKRGDLTGQQQQQQQHVIGNSTATAATTTNGKHKQNLINQSFWSQQSCPLSVGTFEFSKKSIVCSVIIILLMLFCAMIVSHVVILKKLDKLELAFQMQCEQFVVSKVPVSENSATNTLKH